MNILKLFKKEKKETESYLLKINKDLVPKWELFNSNLWTDEEKPFISFLGNSVTVTSFKPKWYQILLRSYIFNIYIDVYKINIPTPEKPELVRITYPRL